MKKLLRVQDRILLGIAFLADVLDEARLLGGVVSASYRNLYGWIPPKYRRNNFYKGVSQLLQTRDIRKEVKEGEIVLVLTNRGKKRLVREFPLIKLASIPWDGRWTIATFDIEEIYRSLRDSFRPFLKQLTFGLLQKSVYITPHNLVADLREFIKNKGLQGKVRIFRADEVSGQDPKGLAEKVWKISKTNDRYRVLLKDWERGKDLTGRQRSRLVRRLKAKLLEVMLTDPFLPKELLPEDWVGDKARRVIASLNY